MTSRPLKVVYLEDTGEEWLVAGDGESQDLEYITPLKRFVQIIDHIGNRVGVTEKGELKVSLSEPLESIDLAASGQVTASGVPGNFWGYCIKAGSDEATLTINDGGSAGKTKFYAEAAANGFQAGMLIRPLGCKSDIYATITGTSPTIYVYYEEIETPR
jgi:hypothetical protein